MDGKISYKEEVLVMEVGATFLMQTERESFPALVILACFWSHLS